MECYFRDIGPQVQARAQLKLAGRQAMPAHELRNLLFLIYTDTELFSRTLADQSRAQATIGVIKRQARQLTRLVDDLLDVSRVGHGRIELRRDVIELSSVITQGLETVESLLREKQRDVSINANHQPVYVNGDFARLVQCFINLVTNAAKYTDAGGQIRIETRTSKGEAIIAITDKGIGISADLLPHVFDLFVQSDRTLERSLNEPMVRRRDGSDGSPESHV